VNTVADVAFDRGLLGAALAANTAGSAIEHVLVALPSFSVGESLLSHYADRIGMLEHRYLLSMLMLARIPSCQLVFVCSQEPESAVVDHYLSLLPDDPEGSVRDRLHLLVVPDRSARSVAAKLLARPDLVGRLRQVIGDRPGFIEPWNVTAAEVELGERVGVPVNGSPPDLLPLGFKSAGRRLLAEAGVPVAAGVEDVRGADELVAAIEQVRRARPDATGVVVKTDDSGAGDGNRIIRFDGTPVRDAVAGLPEWYLDDLARGGVVEELVSGSRVASPSAQADIEADGTVRVLATHEQTLGGPDGQVYLGCRFPADPAHAATIAGHAEAVGKRLAARGALGRFSLDFIAAADGGAGGWELSGLEVNLRKGGTTHPYCALRNLVPGRYDAGSARWVADDGTTRHYEATDNLVQPGCIGMPVEQLIGILDDHGLTFDRRTGTGVVVHMLNGLAIDGRIGLTAIGTTADDAHQLYVGTQDALDGASRRSSDGR